MSLFKYHQYKDDQKTCLLFNISPAPPGRFSQSTCQHGDDIQKISSLAEELLTADGFKRTKSQFTLRVWPWWVSHAPAGLYTARSICRVQIEFSGLGGFLRRERGTSRFSLGRTGG